MCRTPDGSCSGAVAAKVFGAIKQRRSVDTFVLFGAVHHYGVRKPAVFAAGQWETPLGKIDIDQDLAEKYIKATKLIVEDPQVHTLEQQPRSSGSVYSKAFSTREDFTHPGAAGVACW